LWWSTNYGNLFPRHRINNKKANCDFLSQNCVIKQQLWVITTELRDKLQFWRHYLLTSCGFMHRKRRLEECLRRSLLLSESMKTTVHIMLFLNRILSCFSLWSQTLGLYSDVPQCIVNIWVLQWRGWFKYVFKAFCSSTPSCLLHGKGVMNI